MFEQYTEKARRVVFFARYEASEFGSPYIEAAHLLLGLIREDPDVFLTLLDQSPGYGETRAKIAALTPAAEPTATSVDLPLNMEAQRVLAYAAEEALQYEHKHLGTEHLVLGLLRLPENAARQLLGTTKTIDEIRARVHANPPQSRPSPPLSGTSLPMDPDAKLALAFATDEAWQANVSRSERSTCFWAFFGMITPGPRRS